MTAEQGTIYLRLSSQILKSKRIHKKIQLGIQTFITVATSENTVFKVHEMK
jgi:hypothetical protein